MEQSIKQEALKAISSLPESATIEDIMYRLYVIDKVHEGLNDVRNGKVITSEELEKEIQSW
jgi:predicted transcriptional regulator